jgi:hypothetical protein
MPQTLDQSDPSPSPPLHLSPLSGLAAAPPSRRPPSSSRGWPPRLLPRVLGARAMKVGGAWRRPKRLRQPPVADRGRRRPERLRQPAVADRRRRLQIEADGRRVETEEDVGSDFFSFLFLCWIRFLFFCSCVGSGCMNV